MVPTATTKTEIPVMILMALCDLRANKYRRAIKKGRFTLLLLI